MKKVESDWHPTPKGKTLGGIQKEGQYGLFLVWPEEILKTIELI